MNVGRNATFTVTASGTQPLTYQWFFNGESLAGTTNRTLTVTNVQAAQSGQYSVVVVNPSGSVASQVARLKAFVAAAHGFSSIDVRPDRSGNLALTGETPPQFSPYFDLYPIEVSANLTDWTPLATLQRTNAALDITCFLDTNAPQFSQRFYRTPTNWLITPLPPLTGPYPVGSLSRLLTDPSRTNKVRHTNQQFMVTVWYPAIVDPGERPGPYLEKQMNNLYASFLGYSQLTSLGPAFWGHAIPDARLATNQLSFPVVLYSPN